MEKIKSGLNNFRQVFFREKYRFDQGNAFLVFVNFALLVMTLVKQSGGSTNSIQFFIFLGLVATWLLGFILDKVVRVQEAQEKVVLTRSPIWRENFEHHGSQTEKLDQMMERLERIEERLKKAENK